MAKEVKIASVRLKVKTRKLLKRLSKRERRTADEVVWAALERYECFLNDVEAPDPDDKLTDEEYEAKYPGMKRQKISVDYGNKIDSSAVKLMEAD